jgi:hypothetical protein
MLRSALSFLLSLFKSHAQLHLEVLFLRNQLEIVARSSPKLRVSPSGRFFIGILTDLYDSGRKHFSSSNPKPSSTGIGRASGVLEMEKPLGSGETEDPSGSDRTDQTDGERQPSLGSSEKHGKLLKLGIDISESTVLRYMPKKAPKTTKQRWKTFLKNHSSQIVSFDFLVVSTITFRLFYVLVFLSHDRRRFIHFNTTASPTAHWCAQQLRSAFCDQEPPRFLLRDLDAKYCDAFTETAAALGIEALLTAYKSPWQNGYCERLIGSIRRECRDHLIIMNESHLRAILQGHIRYYNTQRTHLGIGKDSPELKGDIFLQQ